MPIYEYQCHDCGRQLELFVQGSSAPSCPECGGEELTRLLSVVATPARDGSRGSGASEGPTGPCGGSCACFPQG